jgi:hypothetical protein
VKRTDLRTSLKRNMYNTYRNIPVKELIDIMKTLMNNNAEPQHAQYNEDVKKKP